MRKFFIAMFMLFFITNMTFAADISISTSVDRNDVEFGDTIELTVSIKKPLENQPINRNFGNGGFSFSFNSMNFSGTDDVDFNIENIPDFDIISRRQSTQSRMINGVGESIQQIILGLVPQKEGSLVIPAFSMKDKDGKEHSSKPIIINVKKVEDDPEDEKEEEKSNVTASGTGNNTSDNNSKLTPEEAEKKNFEQIKSIFTLSFSLIAIMIVIIVLIHFLALKSNNSKNNSNVVEDAQIVKEEVKKKEETLKKEEVVEEVNFSSIAASLKVQYKEVSNEFYRKYFELFKTACCYRNKVLSQDMTYDELLGKCNEFAGTDNIKQATSRLAFDIETVMYANGMPNRQLLNIESDIKEVLNAL